ncbi:MAG: hypothetical protein ABOK23_12515 [Candidatus Methanoperedens sp.]|nr:hypothetical protein [Candidatus Methanoperedens sp.]MCZ7396653.1 hypothetical protein [Candidatus Methanoperedens sp.]
MGFLTQNGINLLLVIIGAPTGFYANWQFNIDVQEKYFITSVLITVIMFVLVLIKIDLVKEELLETVRPSGKKPK